MVFFFLPVTTELVNTFPLWITGRGAGQPFIINTTINYVDTIVEYPLEELHTFSELKISDYPSIKTSELSDVSCFTLTGEIVPIDLPQPCEILGRQESNLCFFLNLSQISPGSMATFEMGVDPVSGYHDHLLVGVPKNQTHRVREPARMHRCGEAVEGQETSILGIYM
jgi:hypothetical protein